MGNQPCDNHNKDNNIEKIKSDYNTKYCELKKQISEITKND